MVRDVSVAVGSALFAAVVMTVGDWLWVSRSLSHRMVYGLVHGAALCLSIGLALGVPVKRPLIGALGGLVVGVLSAASFYVLAPFLRYWAMFAAWVLLWILIALFHRWLRRAASLQGALVRGAIAAIGSGIAFYAISGMWTRWNPAAVNYADHFLRWTIAFLPGFLALHVGATTGGRR
jgi:hypothetical protein